MIHAHLLMRATLPGGPLPQDEWLKVLHELVQLIDMNLLVEPVTVFSNNPGNEGATGFCVIDTSHISFHQWDFADPVFAMIDVYSCEHFDHQRVLSFLKIRLNAEISWKLVDRTKDLADA